jgi:isopentenyldiphosphate isomerase
MDLDGNPASRELGFCPCCGYRTLSADQPGSYEICPVCDWMDDPVQFHNDDYVGDTNHVSLATARENFTEHGACAPEAVPDTRDPANDEERDPNWPYDAEA